MSLGRPRKFDLEEALDRAMEVFWRRGYEGATLPELTEAMGINRPSLYAAFGNKEELFRKVLERYRMGPAAYVAKALAEPNVRQAAEQLLRGGLHLLTNPENPRGCLVVQGALACGESAESIQNELAIQREKAVAAIRERFQQAVAQGELPAQTDCAILARYIATIMHGLAVEAAGGVPSEELERVAEMAMQVWPK